MTEKQEDHYGGSLAERRKMGKGLREQTPRSSHGNWAPAADRPDPLSLLQAQDENRIQKLLPIKYGRMVASPFAFLRGSAVVMASDLAASPVTGLNTILCGDAHLANFGIFASPERDLVFDINDFDEAYPGPWEWDLKRLAASTVVAGRENDLGAKKCRQLVVHAAEAYRQGMDKFSVLSTLDMWYFHIEADAVMKAFERSSKKGAKGAAKVVKKAQFRTQERTLEKLTVMEDGRRRIMSDPPLLIAFRDMGLEKHMSDVKLIKFTEKSVKYSWDQYLDSLPDERRYLLRRYRLIDAALRVGGVGSVGTRSMIALLEGHDKDDALILQLKEAGPSSLEAYLPEQRNYSQHARRVVTGQRVIQAVSDIFLGWHTSKTELQFYWRQLKDMKGSFDVSTMDVEGFKTYVGVCAFTLARAHARTGDPSAIAGYLGSSDTFAEALADFAESYADQTEHDHQSLVAAIKSGRIVAETGI
jgi:uncharacterized protein (DUF2252 family)